ncbi:sigma-54-dependent Fis family transcriptional regulator [Bacillus sp. V5-8f]|uniref:sigma-54 interaction domain-containing protein n=1 Tax=Bacillus sp. V5-8f TaxID=2053044 RepID=UPI000C7658A4|nr:sigma-54-dependent Fis family transcriptional regulator [Bacillus sp. V5-8f]PLT34769.1 sigma-54-dependent Fis family transcriptional regulator [Bacillus sp. V5-8f]
MQKVMIVGAGTGGTAILNILMESQTLFIQCMVDINLEARGVQLARELGIRTGTNWKEYLDDSLDIVIEATGDERVFEEIRQIGRGRFVLIPGSVAYIIAKLFDEKRDLIDKLKKEKNKHDLIFNTTNDGMIVVDQREEIILFNRSAERMVEAKHEKVLGKPITEVIPGSRLPDILKTKRMEVNQAQELNNGRKIITTRIPLTDENEKVVGAFAVFKDITEVVALAEEITNLKEVQTMLEAIIQSSDDAISVVDEQGHGILINPAYTRITGLSKEEVIGKPATTDIYEGESMHMQVLKTRRPVRGVNLRVGPLKKDVIVNVAPIIVDNRLKGSVGVIHDVSEIRRLTKELDRARQIIRTLEAKYSFADIIGESEEMKLAVEQAKLSAKTPATVLLRGESGTGKELFAHAIHNASEKKFNTFVRVNCAALSESLLESELFGYEEGAFSGAKRGGKRGLFEEANNGSIFLDEIGELSPNIQAKLLRVLQENEIVRVGGTKPVPIHVRVIAATNLNLEKAITIGSFREDLYFRLNRIPIIIPPLRKRKDDIKALTTHLIQKINQEYGRNVEGISLPAIEKLKQYHWPGNVRELENILGRAIIFMGINETAMEAGHIPDLIEGVERSVNVSKPPLEVVKQKPLSETMDRYEREVIKQALINHKGNKTATAKSLGISVRSLYYKMEKFHLAHYSTQ